MWSWLRYLYSAILVATALMKVATVDALLHSGGLLSTPLTVALAVSFEFGAAGVIAAAKPRFAYWLAVVTFSMFTLIAGTSWWFEAKCNCFGPRTSTGLPLLVDLLCLTGLGLSYRTLSAVEVNAHAEPGTSKRISTLFIVGTIATLGMGSLIVAFTANLNQDMPAWFGENLLTKTLPLSGDRRVAELLTQNASSVLIFLRAECDHCQHLVDEWHREAKELHDNTQIVSISMSPLSWTLMPGKVSETADLSPLAFEIRWDDDKEPVVEAPTLFVVQGGIVVEVHTGDDALAHLLRMSGGS